MIRKISAAALLCAVISSAFSANASEAACPAPLSSAAAYQSWTAWYHNQPSRLADSSGPRYRQLLTAADGSSYFLQGLGDSSPQIRELSKQALTQLSANTAVYFELYDCLLHGRDRDVRWQVDDILQSAEASQAGDETDASAPYPWRIRLGSLTRAGHCEAWPATGDGATHFELDGGHLRSRSPLSARRSAFARGAFVSSTAGRIRFRNCGSGWPKPKPCS